MISLLGQAICVTKFHKINEDLSYQNCCSNSLINQAPKIKNQYLIESDIYKVKKVNKCSKDQTFST